MKRKCVSLTLESLCTVGCSFFQPLLLSDWKTFMLWKYHKNIEFKIVDGLKKLLPWLQLIL